MRENTRTFNYRSVLSVRPAHIIWLVMVVLPLFIGIAIVMAQGAVTRIDTSLYFDFWHVSDPPVGGDFSYMTGTMHVQTLQPWPYGGECTVFDTAGVQTFSADADDVIEIPEVSWQFDTRIHGALDAYGNHIIPYISCTFDWETYNILPRALSARLVIFLGDPDDDDDDDDGQAPVASVVIDTEAGSPGSHCEQPYQVTWGELYVGDEHGTEVSGDVAWLTLKWQYVENVLSWTVETTFPLSSGEVLYIYRRSDSVLLYTIQLIPGSESLESSQRCYVELSPEVEEFFAVNGYENLLPAFPSED